MKRTQREGAAPRAARGSWEAPIGTVDYLDKQVVTTTCAAGMRVPNELAIDSPGKMPSASETCRTVYLVSNREWSKAESIFAKLPGLHHPHLFMTGSVEQRKTKGSVYRLELKGMERRP